MMRKILPLASDLYILLAVIGLLVGIALASTTVSTTGGVLPFIYSFNSAGTLQEAGSVVLSSSPYWWLNSGGKLQMQNGIGRTLQDELSSSDVWYQLYKNANPVDTDGGTHPQNLFRLVTKSTWEDAHIESAFRIVEDNLSESLNRNASNGLLLMSRYKDNGDTLYYAGLRVDGNAVIKKKYKGTYYTMAQKKQFAATYDRENMPNALPHGDWLSLRFLTDTQSDGSVRLTLYMRREGETVWKQILTATDTGTYGNTAPILGAGFAGMRTDFMDVEFDSFRIENL